MIALSSLSKFSQSLPKLHIDCRMYGKTSEMQPVSDDEEEGGEDLVCIGDHICLYCIDSKGYMFSDRTR